MRAETGKSVLYAVIMAGGKGVRFWPRSRQGMPKHLLDVVSEKPLLKETVERILPLVPADNIYIVTGRDQAKMVKSCIPEIPHRNLIVEPWGRNTAPCIGLAALHVKRQEPDGLMLVLPSDHLIQDEKAFRKLIVAGAEVACESGQLITIGIRPTGPETGYGYVEQGTLKNTWKGSNIYQVKSFREKPALRQAKAFIKRGGFFWNSGIFLWRAESILRAIETHLPDLHEGLLKMDASIGTRRATKTLHEVYQRLAPVSIDYGVLEKSRNVLLMVGDFGWNDVGSWDALWDIQKKDGDGSSATGPCIAVNSKASLVYSPKKIVALIDVQDLIVVETKDALLICRRGSSQHVRKVTDILEDRRMMDYL